MFPPSLVIVTRLWWNYGFSQTFIREILSKRLTLIKQDNEKGSRSNIQKERERKPLDICNLKKKEKTSKYLYCKVSILLSPGKNFNFHVGEHLLSDGTSGFSHNDEKISDLFSSFQKDFWIYPSHFLNHSEFKEKLRRHGLGCLGGWGIGLQFK